MSANIRYRVVNPEPDGKCLPTWAPSSFINTLERAFGTFPVTLGPRDIRTLVGMVAASGGREQESYQALIDAIGDDNSVAVWAEY